MTQYYIAYGSNMNLDQMEHRCPNAKVIGATLLEGYELEFRGVATIVPNQNERVPILVWEITEECEKALDRYEGYPYGYRKEYLTIELNGEEIEAMVYIMNHGSKSRPSQWYYDGIKQGYETAKFGHKALKYLENKATAPKF